MGNDNPHRKGYEMIGNTRTAALVGREGRSTGCARRASVAGSLFCRAARYSRARSSAAGTVGKGAQRASHLSQRYVGARDRVRTASGTVRLVDCMPPWPDRTDVVRVVEGVRGQVPMRMELIIRCGYGVVVPWVRRVENALLATAGPDSLKLRAGVETRGKGFTTIAQFTVRHGSASRRPQLFPSHQGGRSPSMRRSDRSDRTDLA